MISSLEIFIRFLGMSRLLQATLIECACNRTGKSESELIWKFEIEGVLSRPRTYLLPALMRQSAATRTHTGVVAEGLA